MKNSEPTKLEKFLNLDYQRENNIWLESSKSLRKLIGILGMLLPVMLYLFSYAFIDISAPLESISHYYYTRANPIFVVILSCIGIFLIMYSGRECIDFYVSSLAGIFALGVVFFPTTNLASACRAPDKLYAVTYLPPNPTREMIHYLAAALFFIFLAYISIQLFTRSNKIPSERSKAKKIRNKIYRICGATILVCLIVIAAGFSGLIPPEIYKTYKFTFWFETIAIEAFGFSWLIKGQFLFKDE